MSAFRQFCDDSEFKETWRFDLLDQIMDLSTETNCWDVSFAPPHVTGLTDAEVERAWAYLTRIHPELDEAVGDPPLSEIARPARERLRTLQTDYVAAVFPGYTRDVQVRIEHVLFEDLFCVNTKTKYHVSVECLGDAEHPGRGMRNKFRGLRERFNDRNNHRQYTFIPMEGIALCEFPSLRELAEDARKRAADPAFVAAYRAIELMLCAYELNNARACLEHRAY